ncbi:hypothetical protein GCM10020001_048910 [Nonomuraea salmonea]
MARQAYAHVERAQLRQRQGVDGLADVRIVGIAGVGRPPVGAGDGRDREVVREHEPAVGGERDVELQRVDAQLHRAAHPGQGVLGPEAASPPVTMYLNAHNRDPTWPGGPLRQCHAVSFSS